MMEPRVDPFLQTLLSISRELEDDDFKNLKFLCEGTVPFGRLETISRPQELFIELMHSFALNNDNKDYLAVLLYHIGRHDLRNRLLGIEGIVRAHLTRRVYTSRSSISNAFSHVGGLPCKVPHFVGRADECALVQTKLTKEPCRIVTITGPPGFGKSCVAVQVGHDLLHLGIGVYYISLRDFTSMYSMVNALLGALQLVASKEPIQQARYCLSTLTQETVIILDNAEDMLQPHVKDEFCNFTEAVAETAGCVKFLITSRQAITFLSVDMHELRLSSLRLEHATELLLSSSSKVSPEDAEKLAQQCGGVPLVLRTTASMLAKSIDAKVLLAECEKSPTRAFKSFSLNTLSHGHQLFHCLGICFDRLEPDQQIALVSLSVFPTTFRISDAQFILQDLSECLFTLEMMLLGLIDCSLLQYDSFSKEYSVHRVVQAFCKDHIQEVPKLHETFQSAKKTFNLHYLSKLKDLFQLFLTKEGIKAGRTFFESRRNFRQALLDAVKDPETEELCIDTANEVMPFLAKVFRKEKFLSVYGVYTQLCKNKGDEKRYSDCLTSEAYCILSHCACHLPCPSAVYKFEEANKIQSRLGDETSVIRAFALSKFGRCLAQSKELNKGKLLIEKAIAIREALKDRLFVAVAYKDLAAAYAFNEDHLTANKLREEKVLPVYQELLGDHAYTATLMDDAGTSYQSLGDYDNAVKYLREALSMRVRALGDHQETARSWHDLGKALQAKDNHNEALEAFKAALTIQLKVLGAHQETVRSHHEIARLLRILGRHESASDEEKNADQMLSSIKELQPTD